VKFLIFFSRDKVILSSLKKRTVDLIILVVYLIFRTHCRCAPMAHRETSGRHFLEPFREPYEELDEQGEAP
jgi:hypothetical protein